jgi:hypothetical protein
MDNELSSRRGLIIALIVVTILIFVGLVWLIATYLPWSQLGLQSPSATMSDQVSQDCAYSITYWREHPELYPAQVVIGGVVYQQRELEALLTTEEVNPVLQIRAQMAVAFLNISRGSDQSSIEEIIFGAYGWLVNHPMGTTLSEDELEAGTRFLNLLDAYNSGQAGVAPCETGLPVLRTETTTATETATMSSSSTPSQTSTTTPSETPTASTPTKTATYFFGIPSATLIPTTKAPPQAPTNTPIPPTERPTPTKTPIPNTATFTPPPLPTSTYTPPPPLPSPTSSG